MNEPAPRRRAVTRWRTLVLVAVAAAVLSGCDLATGTVRTATELQKAGIDNPNLNYDGGTATLDYDADPNPLEARDEQDRAAGIIWRHLPFRIERITVTSDGGAFPTRRDYPRELLEEQLGPRPANLDRSVEDIARRATLIAGIVGLVVLALIVLVIVLVVRAVRSRPAAQPAPAWPPGPAGPQPWGQQPGQQGWGQPGQQQSWGQPAPPPGQQPWGGQPGYGQPPSPAWPEPPAPQAPPPAPAPQPPGQADAGDDWPSGAPRPQGAPGPGAEGPGAEGGPASWAPPVPPADAPVPPAGPPRGPGDSQRLEPEPPPDDEPGPTPPAAPPPPA
jgi:hypothetical protein